MRNPTWDFFEADESNPLLAKLPAERTFEQWWDALEYDPLPAVRPAGWQPRESHASIVEHVFAPTRITVKLALSLHTMLVVSLRRRDPRLVENRRVLFEFARLKDSEPGTSEDDFPWLAAGGTGCIVMGATGCGKSHAVNAVVRQFPQVVEHDANPECDWIAFKQLVYLRVPMPSDQSRNGLVYGIAREMDKVLGTSYHAQIRKLRTVEEKLVDVLHALVIHRCGMVILEEVQERNVASEKLGSEFVTLFLRFMNVGVPLVLIGNPNAFQHVLEHTQDLRRLTAGGKFEFYPIYDEQEIEWSNQLFRTVWGWNLLGKPDEPVLGIERLVYERTGGVHDFLMKYRCEALKEAIRDGASCVARRHIDAAFHSPVMKPLHKLIAANVAKKPELFRGMSDQPTVHLMEFWADTLRRREAQKLRAKKQGPEAT